MSDIRIGDISATAYKLGGADVSIYIGSEKLYPSESPEPDYSSMYFTIESLEDNNEITLRHRDVLDMSVSTDDGATWSAVTASSEGTVIATINAGEKVLLKGNNTQTWDFVWDGTIKTTGQFNVYGNIMSLLYEDNFIGATSVGQNAFSHLMELCTGLVSAENLILPATTLADNCYDCMFADCSSLTTAPELPAATLANRCYFVMFGGCTSLNYIKMLATDISASECLNYWVSGVASTGTFVKNASMSSLPTGVHGIPSGWTVMDDDSGEAPD